ncbi:MAG: ribonuclease P protein component [Bacilli bacterium]|nr:ribonuclease P protein component [Bacilli bacterium]MDD4053324.1 ribonuclease P protein component [Bacilli bacterium]MDD4411335.1 ribonuclease P protein component [Bacilli bacterium]
MKKINIIKKTQEFEKIIKNRQYYSNSFYVIYIIKKAEENYRFGISIPKKIGNSVLRNKIKRQIKSIINQNVFFNKDFDYVIIVRKEILKLNYEEKKENLEKLFRKIDGACKNEKK